jgi:hypothetical protein
MSYFQGYFLLALSHAQLSKVDAQEFIRFHLEIKF